MSWPAPHCWRRSSPAPMRRPGAGMAETVERVERTCKGAGPLGEVRPDGDQPLPRPGAGGQRPVPPEAAREDALEYQKPEERLFVTDGKTLWAYSPWRSRSSSRRSRRPSPPGPHLVPGGGLQPRAQSSTSRRWSTPDRGSGAAILDLKPSDRKRHCPGSAGGVAENPHHREDHALRLVRQHHRGGLLQSQAQRRSSDAQFTFAPPAGVRSSRPDEIGAGHRAKRTGHRARGTGIGARV